MKGKFLFLAVFILTVSFPGTAFAATLNVLGQSATLTTSPQMICNVPLALNISGTSLSGLVTVSGSAGSVSITLLDSSDRRIDDTVAVTGDTGSAEATIDLSADGANDGTIEFEIRGDIASGLFQIVSLGGRGDVSYQVTCSGNGRAVVSIPFTVN